jgi:hypothetical protein
MTHAGSCMILVSCPASLQVIVWINLSQDPEIMLLQQRAYAQLTSNKQIPEACTKSVDSQLDELRKAAKDKIVLLVLVSTTKHPKTTKSTKSYVLILFSLLNTRMMFGILSSQTHSCVWIRKITPRHC